MEPLALYLLKSSALIALFYVGYHFLLRKETFFKSNRWYLLLGLVTSVLLPLITYKKVVWVDPLPQEFDWAAGPVIVAQPQAQGFEINWVFVLGAVYFIGVVAFVLNFLMDFYSLRKALKGKSVFRQADFRFVDTHENLAPFSYFNYIVYNSSLFTDAELTNIIEHEKVHSNQNHTMDVLFARGFCIIFWFNPFIWLYRKAILQNLEFIADSEATKNIEDKKAYQITLLKVTAHENCVDITNHFYQSLIKKRIVMLNKSQSKKSSSWKYFVIVPALIAFMVCFQVRLVAQERAPKLETLVQNGTEVVITKKSSDADLKREADRIKKEHGVALKFSKVKRNSNGEITGIKATYKDATGKKGTTQVSGNQPIQPFRFFKNDDGRIGFGTGNQVSVIGIGADGLAGLEEDFSFSFSPDDLTLEIPDAPDAPEDAEPPAPPLASGFAMAPNAKSIVIKNKDGKNKVIVDGKVVADVDVEKVLADIGPIIIDGEDVLKKGTTYVYSHSGNGGHAYIVDTDKITKEALEKASAAMKKFAPEMGKMREKMEKRHAEMAQRREQTRADEKVSRKEIEQASEELAQARAELDKARAEMKAEFEKQKAELARKNK